MPKGPSRSNPEHPLNKHTFPTAFGDHKEPVTLLRSVTRALENTNVSRIGAPAVPSVADLFTAQVAVWEAGYDMYLDQLTGTEYELARACRVPDLQAAIEKRLGY